MLLLEDYLDAQVIKKLEQGKSSRRARLLRIILNPQRSLAICCASNGRHIVIRARLRH
jgi:hypothetical protein